MQYINLLAGHNENNCLENFSKQFFLNIGIFEFQKRNSSNYIDDIYFKAEFDSIIFKIYYADISNFNEFLFQINISGNFFEERNFRQIIHQMIFKKETASTFHFMEIKNFGSLNEKYKEYCE